MRFSRKGAHDWCQPSHVRCGVRQSLCLQALGMLQQAAGSAPPALPVDEGPSGQQTALPAGSGRAAVSMMGTIGGATLASQAIVLGASMFKQDPEEPTVAKQVTSPGGQSRFKLLIVSPDVSAAASWGELSQRTFCMFRVRQEAKKDSHHQS